MTEFSGPLVESGVERLKALAQATGFDAADVRSMQDIFRTLSAGWGSLPAGGTPPWASDACDDHSPYELSVALNEKGPQVRVLVEPMEAPYTVQANRAAARRLYGTLERDYHVNTQRLRALEDLLVPEDPQGRFALWYAVSFDKGEAPEFKAYFNLHVQGAGNAPRLTEEAMHRVGFGKAWASVAEALRRRPDGLEELVFFALDLTHEADARVKIYLRHHGATAAFLEELGSVARNHQPGSIAAFCRQMSGGQEGPYHGKGAVTCFTFTDPSDARPVAVTSYFPVPHYTRDDLEVRERMVHFLGEHHLDAAPYLGAVEAVARRRLDAGSGMHTYSALRWWGGQARATVYFSPETYGMQPPHTVPQTAPAPRPAEEIVAYYEGHSIADHPFLGRMRREPVDLTKLARILANFRVGITNDFPRRLAWLTARIDSDALRCTLAKQLNDEMGDGDFSRAHRGLFEKMLSVLKPWAPAGTSEDLAPGRALGKALEHAYVQADPYEGIGASLIVEIYGKQVDKFIADEFRRQKQIPPSDLEWLHLHENLEMEHADESLDMAKLIPQGPALEAAWRGARAVASASRAFFDTLYRACYE